MILFSSFYFMNMSFLNQENWPALCNQFQAKGIVVQIAFLNTRLSVIDRVASVMSSYAGAAGTLVHDSEYLSTHCAE